MADILVCLTFDATELDQDIDRITRGELSTPTVSAVKVMAGDFYIKEIPVYLESQ